MSVKSAETSRFKTFNILSIGQRGVGKTVFLAGSHIELQRSDRRQQNQTNNLWFECEDRDSEDNLSKIVRYIENTGEYPPPTMKITDFSFNLCERSFSKTKKLCTFIWSDIPGEICENNSPEFRKIVYSSQGCCVFIDINALANEETYINKLSSVMEQVTAIANLTQLNDISYPFSIVLTKCDLVSPEPTTKEQVETRLTSLTRNLRNLGINYRVFFSFIPIIKTTDKASVEPEGAAFALLWLVSELEKTYKKTVNYYISNLSLEQTQRKYLGSLQSVFNTSGKRRNSQYSLLGARRSLVVTGAIASGLALVVGSMALIPNFFPQDTSQAGVEERQLRESISELEKLAAAEPDKLEWQLQLGELYQSNGDYVKAEQMYDRVIAKEQNHVAALVKKALIRQQQGDKATAAALFSKAEQATSNPELKAQIRVLAQKNLSSK